VIDALEVGDPFMLINDFREQVCIYVVTQLLVSLPCLVGHLGWDPKVRMSDPSPRFGKKKKERKKERNRLPHTHRRTH
jgi:hypothetical protein